MMMVLKVSERLKEMRKRKGLTQKELANKVGVSESYICQIEAGKMVSLTKLDKMAEALGCKVKDLV